ncbi:hypothetical protein VaNZ11_014349 [Volvox africanus]|uniref:Uncharacterized protein n=1 Tax=Volvox africanus TaxID=51714 RepID=A0ABQ5SJ56_9CHLO|nr:hypothetical protein VaNZ11_014349 [Volvox africanus]
MGSCTALSNRHLQFRGSHLDRLCCGAAPARSFATTYQEVGSQFTRSKEASRRSAHEHFEPQISARGHQQQEANASGILNGASVDLLHVHETSTTRDCLTGNGRGSEILSTVAGRVAAPAASPRSGLHMSCLSADAHFVLHPPELLRQEHQVFVQQDKSDKHGILPGQQQHSVERSPGTNAVGALLIAETLVGGTKICLQPEAQAAEQAAPVIFTAANTSRNPCTLLHHGGVHAQAPSTPAPSSPLLQQEAILLPYPPQTPWGQGALEAGHVIDIVPVGEELPPYLDAASRTAGVVSTSDRQPVAAVGPGLVGDVTSRRRRVTRRGIHGAEQGCAAPKPSPRSNCSPVATLDTVTSPAPEPGRTLATTVAAAISIAEGQGMIGSSATSLTVPSSTTDSTSTKKDKRKSTSVSGQRAAPAAAKPQRPRAPTAVEHRALRVRARLQQAALLPRNPTEDDLRLTVRITCATHWQDLITLLAEHRERHNRGDNQERMRPFLQRSARLQRSRRRRSSSGISGTATDASIAAADAVATAAVAPGLQDPVDLGVPVSALPLTPQHVATALLRTWQLLAVVSVPRTAAEARALASMVDWLARLAAHLAPSPGTTLRELATIFYALVRLRHPLDKQFYLILMNEARKRFSAHSRRSAYHYRVSSRSSSSSGPSGSHKGEREWGSGVAIGAAASSSLPYKGQDMSQLLWSVANCGMKTVRGDWCMSYCSALLPVISELTPQGVSLVLHSFGRLRCTPPPDVLAALCNRLVQLTGYDDGLLPQQSVVVSAAVQYSSNDDAPLKANILIGNGLDHGSARAGWVGTKEQQLENRCPDGHHSRDPAAVNYLEVRELGRQLPWDDLTVLELYGNQQGLNDHPGQLLPSPRSPPQQQQVHQPSREWNSETTFASSPLSSHGTGGASNGESSHRPACVPADVSMSLWALATLRLPPAGYCPQLLPVVERYSLPRLAAFPEQELSNLVWAMARLQYSPGQEWVRHLYDAIARLLPELRPQALSTVLYGLAQMGQRPEAEWLDAILPYVRARLRWFPPQSLALTIHALAVMGCRPPDSWLASFHAQLDDYRGQLDMRVRNKVREAYRLMDFRPGATAAGANGASAQGLLVQQQHQQERQQIEQQQAQQQTTMLEGQQGIRAHETSRLGNDGESVAVPHWNWGHGAANVPSAQRHKQQDQGQLKGGVEGEKEEVKQGPLVRPQLQGRRGETPEDSRHKGREAGGAATDDSVGQMLVRPSRFVF